MLEKASERLAKVDHQPEGHVIGLRLRYEVLRACLHIGEGNLDALSTTGKVWWKVCKQLQLHVVIQEHQICGKCSTLMEYLKMKVVKIFRNRILLRSMQDEAVKQKWPTCEGDWKLWRIVYRQRQTNLCGKCRRSCGSSRARSRWQTQDCIQNFSCDCLPRSCRLLAAQGKVLEVKSFVGHSYESPPFGSRGGCHWLEGTLSSAWRTVQYPIWNAV